MRFSPHLQKLFEAYFCHEDTFLQYNLDCWSVNFMGHWLQFCWQMVLFYEWGRRRNLTTPCCREKNSAFEHGWKYKRHIDILLKSTKETKITLKVFTENFLENWNAFFVCHRLFSYHFFCNSLDLCTMMKKSPFSP